MKKGIRRLSLQRETLRSLQDQSLRHLIGGDAANTSQTSTITGYDQAICTAAVSADPTCGACGDLAG
jgi:hypothetical protein